MIVEKQQMLPILLSSLIGISILLLMACNGDGFEPEFNGSTDVDGINGSPDVDGINGDFKGRLFISARKDPWIMDFSTGRYTPIPGVLWEDNSDYFHNAEFSAYPVAYNGVEFIETIEECRNNPGLKNFDICIHIRDDQGRIISEFEMNYTTSGSARLSRDQQYFTLPLQKINRSPERLTLFTRDGVFIDESDEEDVESFDWLPDNRLIYTNDRSIYATPRGSVTAKGFKVLTFSDKEGMPSELAVSPDGSQLAFTLRTGSNFLVRYGTTWVLDLDSGNLRQLTNTPENDPNSTVDKPIIGDPAWSPDGLWIAVMEGFGRTCFIVVVNCLATNSSVLYAVPSDGENVMLTIRDDIATSAVLIYSYYGETTGRDNPEISPEFDVKIRQGSLAWLPAD